MYDIHFNLSSMQLIYKDCLTTENDLRSSANGLFELAKLLSSEISSFDVESNNAISEIDGKISTVRSLIDNAQNKKASAQSKKKQELSPPPPPPIPSKATPEEKNAIMNAHQQRVQQIERANSQIRNENTRIDSFAKKCDSTIAKLQEIISHLQGIKSSIAKERMHALSEAKDYADIISNDARSLTSVENAMKEFSFCFGDTMQCALDIVNLNPSSIEPPYDADKRFKIKNNHGRVFNSYNGFFKNSSYEDSISNNIDSSTAPFVTDEILIKDREESLFFNKAENARKIKMPSANLHKLGGKAFIAKMKAQGYSLQSLSDGGVIDDGGMMHWKKEDE